MPEIKLPEGMSPEQFAKLFETFTKQRDNTQVRDKAVRAAQKDLCDKYPVEYKALVEKHTKAAKAALAVSGK